MAMWIGSESCGTKKWAFSIFFMILLIHCLAILLFTRGFLLTRTELPHHSQCSDVKQSPCVPYHPQDLNHNRSSDHCWTKPVVDRLVIIVLDALRFDFVAPSTFFPEKKPWMDKLQVLHKLASQPGLSAKIFKAIADPPTTSLQRLKGLTTGGLPTFIDVGNSFGAPAIVEDNLIYQLVQSGKRVVMMGDDTWLQLFPNHFYESYPFPSFNVKDLHTVDDGCIKHLFPALYREDWDVLIAHFLGVDHAGHIFGVDSTPMIEKLQQYNDVLEKVIEVLESQHGPGGLHENTLLLVMGDHGQTLNGDHGGGNSEEVETSIFALSFKKPLPSLSLEASVSTCGLDLVGRNVCISSVQQLDFAVTVSALLGIPFPFGSIGQVNPELFSLPTGTWNVASSNDNSCKHQSDNEKWMQNYLNVLCINSWQVKKYIDVYSTSSMIGFSKDDLLLVSKTYDQAHEIGSPSLNNLEKQHVMEDYSAQIEAYSKFLESVSELARSKWTEFNLKLMGTGIGIMFVSLLIHYVIIKRVDQLYGVGFPYCKQSMAFAYIAVMIHAFSFLSNSYILGEGKVANFLLATTGMFSLRYSILKNKMLFEAVLFVLLIPILRFSIELGQLKQAVNSAFLKINPSWVLGLAKDSPIWIYAAEIVPVLVLLMLTHILYMSIARSRCPGILKYVSAGTIFSFILISMYWAMESSLVGMPLGFGGTKASIIPRVVYAVGLVQLLLLLLVLPFFEEEGAFIWKQNIIPKTITMLAAWSSTVIILSGKQGSLVALAALVGGWCIIRLESLGISDEIGIAGISNFYSSPVTQWSLLAVCLFFCTGHWCAFDGLRYAAAFIGFDEFNLIRQAILLTIETFGFSLILPILGLPFLVVDRSGVQQAEQRKKFFMQLTLVYLIYGLIMATTVTFTILCVAIHRRHLMVWGLFAPKFVFDVVGLLLTDFFICLASLYYFG